MSIRQFREEDLDEVIRISEMAFGRPFDRRLYMAIWESWPEAFTVYEENGRVRAFLAGSLAYDTEARILMLAVHPDFQGRGMGRALLETLKHTIRVLGPLHLLRLLARMARGAARCRRAG